MKGWLAARLRNLADRLQPPDSEIDLIEYTKFVADFAREPDTTPPPTSFSIGEPAQEER